MKLYRGLVEAAVSTLQRIFEGDIYADKAVAYTLKQNPKWGARDRRFIASTIYEIVRWWRLIENTISQDNDDKGVQKYYEMFGAWQVIQGNDLPLWDEFKRLNKEQILKNYEKARLIRKERESIPDWLDELGEKELGKELWEREISELNKEAQVVLRVNALKTTLIELKNKLDASNIKTSLMPQKSTLWDPIRENTLLLEERKNLQHLIEYKNGLFEIQDASSQLIAPFLELESGMKVIDACAGAGGKSLHIADRMQNKGEIISMDVERRKLEELEKRAARAGVSIINTQLINENVVSKYANTADRLLLDVPCSGLGVLRRNPDAKWKLTPDFIEKIKKTQAEIINQYSKMLKPGGLMVYATCSILPGENQNQVKQFISEHADTFEFIKEEIVFPSDGFDGFYLAKVRKR